MNDYEFGNFIYQLRTEKGLSQTELGDMMGVSNKAVSKWEMGVSKPRPDMLITLASFFDVTVDELLAGKRNAQADSKQPVDIALKRWTGEYLKQKKHAKNAIITALLIPIWFFVCALVLSMALPDDDVIGPIVLVGMFLAELIDIMLIFVFYVSANRSKRILHAAYPTRMDEIAEIIKQKKPKKIDTTAAQTKNEREVSRKNDEVSAPHNDESTSKKAETPQSEEAERKKKKWIFTIALIVLVAYVAIVQVVMIVDDNVTYSPQPLIGLAVVLVLLFAMVGIIYIYGRMVKKLIAAFTNQQYEYVIKHGKRLVWGKRGNLVRDGVLYVVAVSYLEMHDHEAFLKYINKICGADLINLKLLWMAIYCFLIEDYEQFAQWRERLQNSARENNKEGAVKLLDMLYKHKKENYVLSEEEKQTVLKSKSNVLNTLFDL